MTVYENGQSVDKQMTINWESFDLRKDADKSSFDSPLRKIERARAGAKAEGSEEGGRSRCFVFC